MKTEQSATESFCEGLLSAIEQVDRPGSVCTSGDLPVTLPGLEVGQVGTIRLPLGPTQAREIIKQCSQAPYGKGVKTVVDTDVRRVWELDPKQFELTNPHWPDVISQITSLVQENLGLENRKLEAHLYKLLLYEKGSFFLGHQDGEKLDRMVATLVIVLPAAHEGGELVVSHEGQKHEIGFQGAASGHELSFAAFYSDCKHEVLPVRKGYRLCLTYNLTLANSRTKQGIAAPRSGETIASIGELLRNWPSAECFYKVAIALDHQYSEKSLAMDVLKGVDRARAEVLFDAAEEADCVAHLALVTNWQSGSAEGAYDYDVRGRGRRWSYDEDEYDYDDESTGSDYEMGDIIDACLSVDHWSDREGKKLDLGEIVLDEDEVVSNVPLSDWEVSEEEFEGYTGNAGMTLERWYRRAAIVIWPKQNHFRVLCNAGTDAAIAGLQAMVKKLKQVRKADREQKRQECLDFATAIIEKWSPKKRFSYSHFMHSDPTVIARSQFLLLLQELDRPELVCQFLAQVVPQDGEIQFDKTFPTFCKRQGWRTFEDGLTAIMSATSTETMTRNAAMLQTLCIVRDKNDDRLAICRRLAERAVAGLEKIDGLTSKENWRSREVDRCVVLATLIKSLLAVDAAKLLLHLVKHSLSDTAHYELTKVHLKTIFGLETWLIRKLSKPEPAIDQWLAHCREELEKRTAQAPTPPPDFRRPSKLSCNCKLCRELSHFLDDSTAPEHRFAVRQDLRQHLHQIIDSNHCDLTHVTSRRGRPYTLVCTKTTASYDAACEIFARDEENLKRLRAIEKSFVEKE